MQEKPRYAGFWIRGLAWLIDMALLFGSNWLLELMLGAICYWFLKLHSPGSLRAASFDDYLDGSDSLWLQTFLTGMYVLASFLYYTVGHWKYGKTIGKWIVGVRVESASYAGYPVGQMTYLQSVARWFASFASWMIFGCGYLMAAMHPKKRTLHDLFGRTVVIRDRAFARPGK
jgi:uncharacterized RDD family membrane protein YckC